MLSRTLLLLCVLFCAQATLAVDKYWRPVTNDFHADANWDPIGVPSTGDRVILDQFGQADMFIGENTSVGGWFQSNNYFGVVTVTNGSTLTVGAQDYYLDSGGFDAGSGTLDVNGDLLVHGGGFTSPATACRVAGDLELNPYPLGGFFVDQTAYWALDGTLAGTLISNVTLNNLHHDKSSGFSFTVPAGMTLLVQGYTELLDGFLYGDGELQLDGDVYVGPSHDGGTLEVSLIGNGTHILNIDKTNWNLDNLHLNRGGSADTTRLVSPLVGFDLLSSTDTLRLEHGVLDIEYYGTFTLNQAWTYIEAGATLIAPPTLMRLEGNLNNINGTFEHNEGTVALYGTRTTSITAWQPMEFYNLWMHKQSSFTTTIADGTVLRAQNRMDFLQGFLNGVGSLEVEDTLIVHSGHQTGTAPVDLTSDKVGNVIVNNTSAFFNSFDVMKDNPSDLVYFETENAQFTSGTGTNRLDIYTGTVAFKDYGTGVDWNLEDIHINAGGTLQAPDGTLRYSGHLSELGGAFDHNGGTWIWDATTTRNLEVTDRIEFWNVELDKPSSFSLTVATGDSLVALNRYTSRRGFLYNPAAWLVAEDSLIFTSNHQRGTIPVVFGGAGDGHWITNTTSTLATDLRIWKDTPGATVWATSDNTELEMGSPDETLSVVEGTLAFEGIGSIVDSDWFQVLLEPGGTYRAWEGTTRHSGSMNEVGGVFEHNMGEWIWDATTTRSLDVSETIEFFNMGLDKASSFALNVADNDTLVVHNKYTSYRGFINGLAVISARDSVHTTTGHQRGTADLLLSGSTDGHWIQDEVGTTFYLAAFEKTGGARVWMESNISPFQWGEPSESMELRSGEIGFQNILNHVDYNMGNTYLQGGVWEAWSGITRQSGNLWENGGTFAHNSGNWIFDATTTASVDVSDRMEFYNLGIDKASSFTLTVFGSDTLKVLNKYTSFRGLVNGPEAWIEACDSVYTTAGHNRGTASLLLSGGTDGHWIQDEASSTFTQVVVDKSSGQNVWMESSLTPFQWGESDESVTVRAGRLAFQNINSYVNLDMLNLTVEDDGILEAWSGSTWMSGNLYETGGAFAHNAGTWRFDATTTRTIDVTDEIRFWNFEINKTSGFVLNASPGDELIAENRFTSFDGFINGADALIVAEDSVVTASTHDRGTTPLEFRGSNPGEWIQNCTGSTYFEVTVNKDTDVFLNMHSDNTNLVSGKTSESLTVNSGWLQVSHGTGLVNWDYNLITLNDGTLGLPEVNMHVQGNLTAVAGQTDVGSGTFIADGTVVATWDLAVPLDFGHLTFSKPSGFSTTMTEGSLVISEGMTTFNDGFLNGGQVWAWGDVDVASGWDGGTFDLQFSGAGDQLFDLTGAENRLEGLIEFNKSDGGVILTSNLIIEDDFEQLVFTSGILTYQDPAANRVRFVNVGTGWTGGNNASHIDGPVQKWSGANTSLPTGDQGVFAPCRVHALGNPSWYVEAEYVNAAPPNSGTGSPSDFISDCEHWTMAGNFAGDLPPVALSYDSDRCGPIGDPSALEIVHWDGSLWNNLGLASVDGTYALSGTDATSGGVFALYSTSAANPMDTSTDPGTGCITDLNNDGTHDTVDLLMMLGEFGCTSGCSNDVTGDGAVDTQDLLSLLGVFGSDC